MGMLAHAKSSCMCHCYTLKGPHLDDACVAPAVMPRALHVQVFETEDSGLRLPVVLQQYIPHGGLLAKAGSMAVKCNDVLAAALFSRCSWRF
jgi:hypothetical protein